MQGINEKKFISRASIKVVSRKHWKTKFLWKLFRFTECFLWAGKSFEAYHIIKKGFISGKGFSWALSSFHDFETFCDFGETFVITDENFYLL